MRTYKSEQLGQVTIPEREEENDLDADEENDLGDGGLGSGRWLRDRDDPLGS